DGLRSASFRIRRVVLDRTGGWTAGAARHRAAHDSAAACGGGVHVIAADRVALVNATKGKARNAGRRLVEGVFAALSWLGSHEISVLLSAVVLSAGAWVFIELADEVTEGEAKSVDETVLLALRNPADLGDPVGPGW